jgi:type II secretion system protein N
MSARIKKIGYGAYIVAIALFFLYTLFPSEALTAYLAHQLSGGRPDLTVTVDRIKPVLPPGLRLTAVRYARNGQPLFALNRVSVRPELMSLFKKGTVYKFDGQAYGGRIVGQAGPFDDETGRALALDARLSALQIEAIPALSRLAPQRLNGRLNGQLSLNDQGRLDATLTVGDALLQMERPLFGLGEINLETVEATLVFDGRQVVVKRCTLKGPEMDGVIAGSVLVNAGSDRTTLNLSGTVSPHHALLAKLENGLAARMLKGRDQIKFRLTGPMSRPAVSLE